MLLDTAQHVPEAVGSVALLEKIGSGGMGVVYRGWHHALRRPFAVKMIPRHVDGKSLAYRRRFLREARTEARLDHPNLVHVHESGSAGEFHYLVMDYVDGPSCRQKVKTKGRMDWRRAVGIVRQVADGLEYAAQRGIIHRDVTPGNILLDRAGRALLADLGLAKDLGAEPEGLTRGGASLGTPYYMSPEQVRSARDVDFRTDIYSLGATLYHLLCGVVPYTGTTFEVMTKHVEAPLPPPELHASGLPRHLCGVLRKMMAKAPQDRYASYAALKEDLDRLQRGAVPAAAGLTAPSMVAASVRPRRAPPRPPAMGPQRAATAEWLTYLVGAALLAALLAAIAAAIA